MKIKKTIEVFHDNGHKIGTMEFDSSSDKWMIRMEECGLDRKDLKILYKLVGKMK